MGSDARVVRSVNIAAIVLCGLSLFCAVALLIFMGLSSTMLTDPQVMAGVIDKLDSGSSAFDGNSYATEFDYGGLTPAEASAMATAGFAVLIALILGFVGLKVVALIAAIIAVRNYTNPARYGRIFGWAIAAAITSLLIMGFPRALRHIGGLLVSCEEERVCDGKPVRCRCGTLDDMRPDRS